VRYNLAVRTRSESDDFDYEWNPQLPREEQWWRSWLPDIAFRKPVLLRWAADTEPGYFRVYLNGIIGDRLDHVQRHIKYELAIFPCVSTQSDGADLSATLDAAEVQALINAWWEDIHQASNAQVLGKLFDNALEQNGITAAEIDHLAGRVNQALVAAIKELTPFEASTQPLASAIPLVVGEGDPNALRLLDGPGSVIYAAALSQTVFTEHEAARKVYPNASVIVVGSSEPPKQRYQPPNHQVPLRTGAASPPKSTSVPTAAGGCAPQLALLTLTIAALGLWAHRGDLE